MFYAITAKVFTYLPYNLLRIYEGVGWSFMQNFRKFHRISFQLSYFEILGLVAWFGWLDLLELLETLHRCRQGHMMSPYKRSSHSVKSSPNYKVELKKVTMIFAPLKKLSRFASDCVFVSSIMNKGSSFSHFIFNIRCISDF